MFLPCCCIFLLIITLRAFSQNEDYLYQNWPGKGTDAKRGISVSDNLVEGYKLSLAKGYNDNSVFYRMPLNDSDTSRKGRLQLRIYPNPSEAQLALTDYLNSLTFVDKPQRMDNNDLKYADVAFGMEYNNIFRIAYTKNNVFVVIHATNGHAILLAEEIANTIANASAWNPGDQKPHLIFTK